MNKRMIVSLLVAGLIVGAASAASASDWDEYYGYDSATYVVPVARYVVPRYRVPVVAPVVRPVVRVPVATAVRVPVNVVRNRAPVARATRIVGRRVLLRY